MKKLISLAALIVVSFCGVAASSGIYNGSFEQPVNPAPGVVPDGWNVESAVSSTGVVKAVGWSAVAGSQYYDAGHSSNTNTRLWQNTGIQMIEGAVYTVKFSVTRLNGIIDGGRDAYVYINAADNGASRGTAAVTSATLYSLLTGCMWHRWNQSQVSYTCDAAHAGKYLVVELGGSGAWAGYDNVTLEISTRLNIPIRLLDSDFFWIPGLGDYNPVDVTIPIAYRCKIWDVEGNIVSNSPKTFKWNEPNTISLPLAAGTYYVAIKSYQHMQKVIEVVKGEGPLTVDNVQLEGGDLHGDNECFFTTLSIVLAWFGAVGDPYPTD